MNKKGKRKKFVMPHPRKVIFFKAVIFILHRVMCHFFINSRLHLVRRSFVLRDRYFFHGVRKKINEFQCVILSTKTLVRCKRNCVPLATIYNARTKETLLSETKCNTHYTFLKKKS